MRMQIEGVIRTGNPLLDGGITGLIAYSDGDEMRLYASTGRNGGLTAYRLDNGGNMVVQSQVVFPAAITGTVSDHIILETVNGAPMLFVGAGNQGLIGYGLQGNLALGGRSTMGWTQAENLARGSENVATLEALVTMAGRPGDLLPPGQYSDQIVSLRSATVQGREFVVFADADSHSVTTLRRDASTGQLIPADEYGAAHGLGIHAPTAMELVTVGNATYVILASGGSSSLSVMRITGEGRLQATDHVIDTGATHIAGVQAMAVVQEGGHTFVIAGGADHGVSLFLLLPGGRLVLVDSVANSEELSMYNVAAISATVHDGTLHIFIGSQSDQGATHLTVAVDNLGVRRFGSRNEADLVAGTAGDDILSAGSDGDTLRGGAGDDVLISGPGRTTMTGGAGRDIFVINPSSTRVDITDFQPGQDRLDLSSLPMLRDLGQLTFTSTANGARITYRDTVIVIRSADGSPLELQDIFPSGYLGLDRIPILPRVDPAQPGEEIFGTPGDDLLTGTERDDTIWGLQGDDLIQLIGGNDVVFAGPGDDTVVGASTGNATMYGGDGDDVIYAIGGDNWLGGGPGNDTLYGGSGNDIIWGAAGDDVIFTGPGSNEAWGGEGNDTIYGGDGGNLMGAPGDGEFYGGAGSDTIWGARGNDLIHTGNGDNNAWGGPGEDTIHGGNGNDTLGGGPGDDLIYGGAGDDMLFGGEGDDTLYGGAGADTFVFYRNQDTGRVMDFNPEEGDILLLARWLWGHLGDLTPAEVVDRFARVDQAGNTVLDFGSAGGTVVILDGFDDLEALSYQIEII